MTIRATIRSGICVLAWLAASPAVSQQSREADGFRKVVLEAHNLERSAFGSAPLAWNGQLEAEARVWAERLASENRLRHSRIEERGDTGENLWIGTANAFRPDQMIASFNAERRHFRAGTFPEVSLTGNWADVGHYTQVVWAETREVGCAVARGSQMDVLVCRYWPAGNVIGTRLVPRKRVAQR